jgi:hypothetical protein
MLLPGRVADDAREPIVEARIRLSLDNQRLIRNTEMHDFGQPTNHRPTKDLTKGGDLRKAQDDVPFSQ